MSLNYPALSELTTQLQLTNLMEAAGEAVFKLDPLGQIRYASQRAVSLFGYENSLVGMPLDALLIESDRPAFTSAVKHLGETDQPIQLKVRISTSSGSYWFELQLIAFRAEQQVLELLVIGRDLSRQYASEERRQHRATHDALTGLPNHSLLSDRISMAIAQARRTGIGFSVFCLNLDGFKKVNDALGHSVGDALLCIAGERLQAALRDVDTLARIGGDEFVIVLPGAVDEAEVQLIARRLIAALQMPFDIQGQALYIGTSIGVAMYPQHGESEVKLLAHADTAMYYAKETGKARCIIYSPQRFSQPEHDVSLEAAMFEAVRNGEFLLHYQPIVNAQTEQIVGFEALMRWMRPESGLILPTRFIPMAENNGLINLLGAWALKAACVQLRRFEEAAGRQMYMSVNVSPRQFRNDQFITMIDEALALSGLEGGRLLLEITEGILMSDPEHAQALLTAIAKRDVRIAIDDFGTGYSSLAYLKSFPINALKIDRAFIKDLPGSLKDSAICNVVLNLASNLSLSTVAEGVENQQQLDFLARQGCTFIQGYHTGRPLLPDEVIKLLAAANVADASGAATY